MWVTRGPCTQGRALDKPACPSVYAQDELSCIGCKQCVWLAPATFRIEPEWGRSRVFAQWCDTEEAKDTAIDSCPVSCIHWCGPPCTYPIVWYRILCPASTGAGPRARILSYRIVSYPVSCIRWCGSPCARRMLTYRRVDCAAPRTCPACRCLVVTSGLNCFSCSAICTAL
jgi:ferredoxin